MASKYQSVASIVLYSGSSPESGKLFGSMPPSTNREKARSICCATSVWPVVRASPGSAIIVSRPQSQIKRHRPIESGNACAIFESFDAHAPIAGMRGRMKISIIYERLYFKVDAGRGRAVNNAVLHKRRILAVLHPYALFDACRSG